MRPGAFILCAMMAAFCLSAADAETGGVAGAVLSGEKAVLPARPALVVYGSERPSPAESLLIRALQPGGEARRLLLDDVRDVQFVTVPTRPDWAAWAEGGVIARAAAHGVSVFPTLVFLDSRGRVFDRMEGVADAAALPRFVTAVKEAAVRVRPMTEVNGVSKGDAPLAQSVAICRMMERVPVEAWFRDYPGTMKRLEKLGCREPSFLRARAVAVQFREMQSTAALAAASFRAQDALSIRRCLDEWRRKADSKETPLETRQMFLLAMVHPLWIRLENVLYQGAHGPGSEEAFNKAIEVLDEVRDMDASTVCGRRAHQLREDLRRARLAAARHD